MRTRLLYRVTPSESGYVAACGELALEATGPTRDQAVAALLAAAKEALRSVEAVAPPSRPRSVPEIELVLEPLPPHDREGPGEADPR